MTRRLAAAIALLAALTGPLLFAAPVAEAHAGTADGTRPFVTGLDPPVPGVAASVIFAGDWQVNLLVVGGDDVTVLDDGGRPFIRIGRASVEGDYGAPAWYPSAVVSTTSGIVQVPDGITDASPPDWRPVARARTWAWYDRRIKGEPGVVTPDMIRKAEPVRLRDFSIPLQVGNQPVAVKGYIEFEPPRGNYLHRLTSAAQAAPGVGVGLLGGRSVPTLTVRNDAPETVTVLGADGEAFLRISDGVDVNAASPTWTQVGRSLGRLPKVPADSSAPPQWERISDGRLASWADFRSRPPDTEPQIATDDPVDVKRWTIPLRIGDRPVDVTGVTSFEPLQPPGHESDDRSKLVAGAAGIGGVLLLAGSAVGFLRRRGSRSLR
jgi:hypothetical protein